MIAKDLLWAMLPDGLEPYFDVENYEKDDEFFRITLIEKNIVPGLPEKYRGKRIINNVLKSITVVSFPVRGRKGELILKRRYFKFEGVDEMYCQPIDICAKGTKLDQEFGNFLKEVAGIRTDQYQAVGQI